MGLLMVGYGLRDSISSISQYQYGELQLYDCSIYLSDDFDDADMNEMKSYLDGNKDIQNYMNGRMESVTTQNEEETIETYLIVIPDTEKGKEFFHYRDRKSKEVYELKDDGIIISEKTAKMLGASVGDTILLTESGMNEHEVTITAICENYVSHWIYMTEELYKEVYDENPFYNSIFINVGENVDGNKLNRIGEEILEYDNILNVQYTEDMVASLDGMLVALDRVMVLLILIAGLLSFVVLYNLNNINITERRRELATLKVLGFYDNEVAMYVYRENILLTLFGTLVGCVLGKFLHYFTIVTVEVDAAMFGRIISVQSYLICALFTIGFSIIVNIIMFFKLRTIDMVESLKSVE
jgi:putative ABC transport system permease protein